MSKFGDAVQQVLFTILVTAASRFFVLRDWITGRVRDAGHADGYTISRHSVASGRQTLDAVLTEPADQPARAALLICHGIGERVENWLRVQQMLADDGVVSLVFDYAGYGRSTGWVHPAQCELDAVSAFHALERLAPDLPVSLLGFSLGSGIAVAVMPALPVRKLVLCSAYTSFREATTCTGLPRLLAFLTPAIWRTTETLETSTVPVLIVHSENDGLFPVQMAYELKAAAGDAARVVVASKLTHDEPYYRPERFYWRMVSGHVLQEGGGEDGARFGTMAAKR